MSSKKIDSIRLNTSWKQKLLIFKKLYHLVNKLFINNSFSNLQHLK